APAAGCSVPLEAEEDAEHALLDGAGMVTSGISRIVVGVDGSEHSGFAVEWAVRMAREMGSEVVAVYAIDLPVWFDAMSGAVPAQYDPAWRAEIKAEFEDQWCKPLKDAGIRYRTIMEDGRPASVIAAVADDVDADLVVVGRRGRGGVAELVLGSVSHELVVSSKRAVLIVSGVLDRHPGSGSPGGFAG
ncbi:MAG TPA: universal stress protein, partial [Candidatus Sulfotelmatobacter sp.]|nr:universal stress protein [Candidatus Sulfotelmatobacter sp.]